MTTVGDIRRLLDQMAPFDSCESFDNVGILIGGEDLPVSRCLVTLDVTRETVEEAEQKGCEMILSHHPVIFHPMKRIPFDSVQGMLLAKGIAVLSAHTNFDKAPGGLNESLLRLCSCRVCVFMMPENRSGKLYSAVEAAGAMSMKQSGVGQIWSFPVTSSMIRLLTR